MVLCFVVQPDVFDAFDLERFSWVGGLSVL